MSSRPLLAALVLVVAGTLFPPPAAHAQSGAVPRPKVGLVLGGGGARGGAHLGVLEVLDELRIPVDCVAGTSMGALVGGAFVAGVSPAQMRETIGRTDWDTIFDDSAGRDAVNARRKGVDDRFYSGLEFGVTKDGLRYREGAVAGEKIKLFFNHLVRADLGERNIEHLPLPLSLLATDIGTGERVAMRSGNLTTAMRASMSVPGVIAPVHRDGRKLVDGGLVDNVPVQEVRDLCGAEVVIAVNVGSPLMKPEEVTGVLSVVGQMVNLLTEQNVAKSLSLLGPADIYMRPELGAITAADFGKQLQAADIGRAAALAQSERLARLSVPHAEYQRWKRRVQLLPGPTPPVIDEVQVAATRFVNPRDLRENIAQKTGEPLDAKRLAEDLVLIYSQGDLQTLDYAVLRERDKTVLRITPVEKTWGPDYLRFGLNIASDFRGESSYNLRGLYRRTWLNSYGAEWLTVMQVGSDQALGTEFYQPLDFRQRFFVQPSAYVRTSKAGLFFDGDRLAEYFVRQEALGLEAGANLGTYGQAKLGWLERRLTAKRDTGSTLLPDGQERIGGVNANLALDTHDYAFFPTKGFKVDARYFDAIRARGDLPRYSFAEARLGAAASVGDLIFLGAVSGGKTFTGELPLADVFALGGQGRLSSFAPGQILGNEYALGSFQFQYRLNKPVPVIGLMAIAGLTVETGRMRGLVTEPGLDKRLTSFGAYLAANTPIGPAYLGFADSPDGKGRFYLFLGTP